MKRVLLNSKLHRLHVTQVEIDYEGSCALDKDFIEAAKMTEYEKVEIYNVTNGERFSTYLIAAEAGSKTVSINGAAAHKASPKDWSTEYLSLKISVKKVNNVEDAVEHINKYGTSHTEAIISNNKKNTKYFFENVKSSILIHNSSTQFADGAELGFGGEVGISTNKLPPRGPVGLNQLVSYKYEVIGNGQIRS